MPISLAIVDDHEMLRDGLKARFSDKPDFTIVGEGETGEDAIALYDNLKPDVLLTDIAMPDMNGLDAAATILDHNPKARIVFLSVYDDPQYVAEAMRIGAKGFVLKDVDKHEMCQAIRRVAQGGTYFANKALKALEGRVTQIDLTNREREVLREIAKGHSNKEIAHRLELSVRTVESHRSSIREKSGGGNAAALAKLADEMGLV